MRLNNHSIPRRIGGGFALVLFLLVALGLLGGVNVEKGRTAIDVYSDVAENALLVMEVGAKFEAVRRHVLNADSADLDSQLTEIQTKLRQAENSAGNETDRKALAAMSPRMETYRAALMRMRDGGDGKEIKVVGDKIVEEFADIGADQLHFLQTMEGQAKSSARAVEAIDAMITAGALFFGALAAWIIGSGITKPLTTLTAAMKRLANGELDAEVPPVQGRDELAAMTEALAVFKTNAVERQRLEERAKQEALLRAKRHQVIEDATTAFDRQATALVGSVADASQTVAGTAEDMSAQADQTSRQAAAVAAAATQAAANVETVAAAAEELSASIREISRQVGHSNEISRRAADQTRTTDTQVQNLAQAAGRIGEVVSLINDIASQTNLLALNATIEAARAGEAGKGFAVVANEVKHLANQTAKATEEIAGQISAVQDQTHGVVDAIRSIGAVIDEVSDIAGSIAAAVEQQSAATAEIARNVEQAAEGTSLVSKTIGDVQTAATHAGTSAGQLLGASRGLAEQSRQLRGTVDDFLQTVRTA